MPLPKQVPSLKELCLEDFVKRIVFHGECFQKSEAGGKTHQFYKLIQRHFTDIIVDKFFQVKDGERQNEKRKEFMGFFLPDWTKRNSSDWPCLEFLFNERTTTIERTFKGEPSFSEEACNYIISKCKHLRRVNKAFLSMFRLKRLEAFSQFKYLQFVNVNFSSGRDILLVLEMCPLLTNLTAYAALLNDELLLSLCKHRSGSNRFEFCPENGYCSTAGKNLEFFLVEYYANDDKRTAPGLACALQHFPKLKGFFEKKPPFCIEIEVYLPVAILTLQDSAQENGKPFVYVEVNGLCFYSQLHKIFDLLQLKRIFLSCPKLEYLQMDLELDSRVFSMITLENIKQLLLSSAADEFPYPSKLKQLLAKQGPNIKILHIVCGRIDVEHINDILDACCNLKELCFFGSVPSGKFPFHRGRMPPVAYRLEKIAIKFNKDIQQVPKSYFYEVLCRAKSVKRLGLFSDTAEREFFSAMEKNNFCCLEKLYISASEVGKMCLDKVMNQKNSLEKIFLPTDDYTEQLKYIAAQKKYDLKIRVISQLCFFE